MSNIRLRLETIVNEEVAANVVSEVLSLDDSLGFSVAYKKTDSILTNKTFDTVSLNAFSISAHGYKTGLKVRFTTSGTLPTGLSLATDYYLIAISENTLMVADTQQNASDGVFLTISGGSGTHTVSVQTFLPCYVKLEGSLDNEEWFQIGLQEIGNVCQNLEYEKAFFHYLKVTFLNESGQRNVYLKTMIKGY